MMHISGRHAGSTAQNDLPADTAATRAVNSSTGSQGIPAYLCCPTSRQLLVNPWMDMDTGESFEFSPEARQAHPNSRENFQLRKACQAYQTHLAAGKSPQEIEAALADCVTCHITQEAMRQPVRAPDNILYEAAAIETYLRTQYLQSPLTRQKFPGVMRLPVDRRLQRLSIACGTPITTHELTCRALLFETAAPRYASDPDAMERGIASRPSRRWAPILEQAIRGCMGVCVGVATGSLGAPPWGMVGCGLLFFCASNWPNSVTRFMFEADHIFAASALDHPLIGM